MAYTVRELITKSYYLSGMVARDFETVTGSQISDGFDLLNGLINIKTADNRLIPYFTSYSFVLTAGQQTYFIPKLISIETMTFFINQVRYSMLPTARKQYFGSPRVENITSLPFNYHMERVYSTTERQDGANVFLYFLPVDNYPAEIHGKFALSSFTSIDQDLSLIIAPFYIEYLRIALAEYICAENNISLQPQTQQKLNKYEEIITDVSPIDLSTQKMSSLQRDTGLNWGDVNVGRGWRP